MEQSLKTQIEKLKSVEKLISELSAEIGTKLWLKRKRKDEVTESYIICMIFLRLLTGIAAIFGKKDVVLFVRGMINTLLDFSDVSGDKMQQAYSEIMNELNNKHNVQKDGSRDTDC